MNVKIFEKELVRSVHLKKCAFYSNLLIMSSGDRPNMVDKSMKANVCMVINVRLIIAMYGFFYFNHNIH
jgi:hypothetical protein